MVPAKVANSAGEALPVIKKVTPCSDLVHATSDLTPGPMVQIAPPAVTEPVEAPVVLPSSAACTALGVPDDSTSVMYAPLGTSQPPRTVGGAIVVPGAGVTENELPCQLAGTPRGTTTVKPVVGWRAGNRRPHPCSASNHRQCR